MSQDKIHAALRDRMAGRPPGETIGVIVRHKPGFFHAHAAAPGARSFNLIPATAMKADSATIEELDRDETVDMIWPDLPVHTCLDESVPLIGVPRVWEAGFDGTGVRVAVVDTGIDPTHPDFDGRIKATGFAIEDDHVDGNGHGTHVAAILAGSGAASGGKYRGVAPGVSLFIHKSLDSTGAGMMSSVMAGIEWAVEQGVQVINLSLSGEGSCDGTDALSAMCDEAVERGLVVCVAAGNFGPGAKTIGPPACARLVITVGASSRADGVVSFSSRGPTADGRIKPDVLMPGENIVSARASGTSMGAPLADNQKYTAISGTSMATPHASGLCALLLQANPELTPSLVKGSLIAGAVDLGAAPNDQGAGRVDAFLAYEEATGEEPPAPPPPEPVGPPQPIPPPPVTPPLGCDLAIVSLLVNMFKSFGR